MHDESDAWSALAHHPLLRGLPEAELDELLRLAGPRLLSPGLVLFDEMRPPAGLFLIEEGEIRQLSRAAPWGADTLVGGGWLGESVLWPPVEPGVQAVVVRETRAWLLPAAELLEVLERHPGLGMALHTRLARRLQERLCHSQRLAHALFEAGRLAGGADRVEDLFKRIPLLLLEVLPETDAALLWLTEDPIGVQLLVGMARAPRAERELSGLEDGLARGRARLPPGDPLLRLLERLEGSLELDQLPAGTVLQDRVGGNPALLVAPLRARARLEGALVLLRWGPPGAFPSHCLEAVQTLSRQLEGLFARLGQSLEQRRWAGVGVS